QTARFRGRVPTKTNFGSDLQMHRAWFGLALALAIPALAQETTDQKIQDLQKEIDELQREVKAEQAARPDGQSAAEVRADYTNGFMIRSRDGNFVLHIGADLQVDNHSFTGDGSANATDNIVLRRVRPILYGTVYRYVDYFIRPDFGLGTTA